MLVACFLQLFHIHKRGTCLDKQIYQYIPPKACFFLCFWDMYSILGIPQQIVIWKRYQKLY